MNRSIYFNFIEEKLSILAFRIEQRGKLNILDFHLHSENFYRDFMNILFGWHLENMNAIEHNAEAIDLIDKKNKIIIQVSATATKQKIESALISKKNSDKNGYSFKFISISKDAEKLRTLSYKNPYKLSFQSKSDIYDIRYLLNIVSSSKIEHRKIIYDFIKKELGKENDFTKLDSNLTTIINILASENWDSEIGNYQIKDFEINRKIEYNKLNISTLIEEYAVNSTIVDKIYKEFNQAGVNKSSSVLASIRSMYIKNKVSQSNDDLFFNIIEQAIHRIQNSSNYNTQIPFEELELCVNILIVDTFIRCKIFENPEGYKYAATR